MRLAGRASHLDAAPESVAGAARADAASSVGSGTRAFPHGRHFEPCRHYAAHRPRALRRRARRPGRPSSRDARKSEPRRWRLERTQCPATECSPRSQQRRRRKKRCSESGHTRPAPSDLSPERGESRHQLRPRRKEDSRFRRDNSCSPRPLCRFPNPSFQSKPSGENRRAARRGTRRASTTAPIRLLPNHRVQASSAPLRASRTRRGEAGRRRRAHGSRRSLPPSTSLRGSRPGAVWAPRYPTRLGTPPPMPAKPG